MSGDYPTEEELKTIREWPDNFWALMDYVKGVWWMPSWGWHEKDGLFSVSTGGWSGNEDIIGAMSDNIVFWSFCWLSAQRGGHYVFDLSKLPGVESNHGPVG